MSVARGKGTSWESAIVKFLRANGAPNAERRALSGVSDKGDVAGVPGLVVEAKACRAIDLSGFVNEAVVEAANARARIGVAWIKRRGKTSPGEAYVAMTGDMFVRLLRDAGYIGEEESNAGD